MRGQSSVSRLGALAMLAIFGATFVADTCAQAQTLGMERRQERRSTRQEARQDKRACNASGESTRAGCRQEKREVRQEGRQARSGAVTP